jgi:hypothetical protein
MKWGMCIFRLRLRMVATSPMLWILLLIAILFSMLPVHQYKANKQAIIPIAIINRDDGIYSTEFVGMLKKIPNLTIVENDTLENAQKKLSIGDYEAVVEIADNFSDQIIEKDYTRVFNIYVSPSSSVAVFLTEVLAEKYIEIWGQELVINDYRDVMAQNQKPLAESDVTALRNEMMQTVKQNSLVFLDIHQQESAAQQDQQNTPENALQKSALYYCALVIIFIFLSCRWVIDLRTKGIGIRMHSMGITSTIVTLASSLAMALLCELLLFVSLIIGALMLHASFALVLKIIAASLLYFIAVIGISIAFSSMLKESISLMLISPIAVMVNSLFGGMLSPLPALTLFWQKIVFALPGRQLTEAFITGNYLPLAFGALVFSLLGIGAVRLLETFKIRESGES